MTRAFSDIAQTLQMLLPPWGLAAIAAVLGILAIPFWLQSMRTKKIHGRIRRMVRASDEERRELADEALALAGDHPRRLVALVHNAMKYGLYDLRNHGIRRLEETGGAPEDLEIFHALLRRERKPVGHPLEVALAIERLLEEGMDQTARHRLTEALKQHPADPDLRDIEKRLSTP